jgi:hypothetical protein
MGKSKGAGGRPKTVITDKELKTIKKAAGRGMTIDQISDLLGIDDSTFYRLKNEDLRVLRAYREGRAKGLSHAYGLLREKMDKGCTQSLHKYIVWFGNVSERQNINLSSEDGTMRTPPTLLVKFIETGDTSNRN